MSRYLIVTWDGAGNLVSTLGIAKRLAAEGHEVRLLGHRSIQERCGDHGWRFRRFAHTVDWGPNVALNRAAEPPDLRAELWFSLNVTRDVFEELDREPTDVLIADCMLFGAICAGEARGLPTVSLFHTAFAPFRGGRFAEALATGLPAANWIRVELGLSTVEAISEMHEACALSLVAVPREFEPEIPFPANVRHIGPVLDAPPLSTRFDDIEVADSAQPLVVVSLSTSHQDQTATLQRLVDALSTLPIRVVATTGPAVDPDVIRPPGNAQVVRFVPHDRLLPKVSLVVTHAGLGTVMTTLAHGVPMLCVPMGRDQYFNASRVEALGAGTTIAMDADAATIGDAVRDALKDATLREGAKRMATVIAGYGGAADAVIALERLA